MNRFKKCCVSGPVEVEMFEITSNPVLDDPIAATIICKTCGLEFQGDMRPSDWGKNNE